MEKIENTNIFKQLKIKNKKNYEKIILKCFKIEFLTKNVYLVF